MPLEILTLLLRKRADLLTRGEIARAVWPESDPADLTHRINMAINRIRTTLGDDPANPIYIQTVIGKGYRFISAVEEETDGERISALDGSVSATVAAGKGLRRQGWMWVLPAALVVFVLGTLYLRHARTVAEPKIELVRFTSNPSENRVTAADLSPDGKVVAYAYAGGVALRGEHDLAAHSLRVPEVRGIERLSWSPNGRQILMSAYALTGSEQLWMLATDGSAPRLLRDHARLGTISPDGSRVAFVTDARSEVWVEGRSGENPKRVFAGSPNDTFPAVLWSADGSKLLLERHTAVQSEGHFHSPRTEDEIEGFHSTYLAVDADGGRIAATEEDIRIGAACLLAGNRLLFSRSESTEYGDTTSLWKVTIDRRSGAFVSKPEKVLDLSAHLLTLSVAMKTGAMAAVLSHGRPAIYTGLLHLQEGKLDAVKLLASGEGGPHGWTPDSGAVLFESNNMDARNFHIYKQELSQHEPESLVSDMGGESIPRLTPEPHAVLFQTSTVVGSNSIWRVSLTGGRPTPVTQGRSLEYRCPAVGPACVLGTPVDSQQFAFRALDPVKGRGRLLFTMPASWNAHGDWDVSPDGTHVAAVSPLSSQPEIRVAAFSSGVTQEILLPIKTPLVAVNWMPDGNGWIIATATALGGQLLYVDAKGKPKILHETTTPTWGVPSPNGKRLAFTDQDVDSNVWITPQT